MIQPIAELVKQLQFVILHPVVDDEFTYCAAQSTITCLHDNCFILHQRDEVTYKSNICCLILEEFGDAEYDLYQIQSDFRSDIQLGRVFGTDRGGHDLDENRRDLKIGFQEKLLIMAILTNQKTTKSRRMARGKSKIAKNFISEKITKDT